MKWRKEENGNGEKKLVVAIYDYYKSITLLLVNDSSAFKIQNEQTNKRTNHDKKIVRDSWL